MVGAVVQILIAEQTAPAVVAYAFPWLVAGAVHAARIRRTLIAQRSLPALLTAASRKSKRKKNPSVLCKLKIKFTLK